MSAGVSTSGEWQNLDNDGAINGTDRDVLSCKCLPGIVPTLLRGNADSSAIAIYRLFTRAPILIKIPHGPFLINGIF